MIMMSDSDYVDDYDDEEAEDALGWRCSWRYIICISTIIRKSATNRLLLYENNTHDHQQHHKFSSITVSGSVYMKINHHITPYKQIFG